MKVKANMGIAVCLIMVSISACGSQKESSFPIQSEQTQTISPTEKSRDISDNTESVENAQALTVNVDYTEIFQSTQGCAAIFDASKNTYFLYNEDGCNTKVSPESTFKVISTLIGLHEGVIVSEESQMGYDGIKYPVNAWNADLSLEDAFQNSCVWYFRKVIDEVGQEIVQKNLEAINYGNGDISEWNGNGINSFPELNGFWLDSSLKISPLEQIDVLRSIIDGESIFTEQEVKVLKNIMCIGDSSFGKIYGKTGTGTEGTAWFIGFVEKTEGNTYFAIYLNGGNTNEVDGSKAKEIAINVLETEQ